MERNKEIIELDNSVFNEMIVVMRELIASVQNLKNHLVQEKENYQITSSECMTIEELSVYIPTRPAVKTIRAWKREKALPFHRAGRKLYFIKTEIDEWLKNNSELSAEVIEAELHAWEQRNKKNSNPWERKK